MILYTVFIDKKHSHSFIIISLAANVKKELRKLSCVPPLVSLLGPEGMLYLDNVMSSLTLNTCTHIT